MDFVSVRRFAPGTALLSAATSRTAETGGSGVMVKAYYYQDLGLLSVRFM